MNIEDIKLFVADLDGTLIEKGENILPFGKKALEYMHSKGVKIVPATGRPLDKRIIERSKSWDLSFPFDYVIGMNGGDLYEAQTEKTDHFCILKKEYVRKIVDFLDPLDVSYELYLDGYEKIIVNRIDDRLRESMRRNLSNLVIVPKEEFYKYDTGKIEVAYKDSVKDELMKVVEANRDPHYASVITFPGTIEFMDPGINKGVALSKIQERLGIKPENTIACGDMENDIPLFKYAGLSICLKNGSDATKAAADAVTDYTVNEDGLGRYLCEKVLHI